MSFAHNMLNNDTMKYWSKKLNGKWYKFPFLWLKSIEIDTFISNLNYNASKQDNIESKKCNNINIPQTIKTHNNIKENDKNNIVLICPFYIKDSTDVKNLYALLESICTQTLKPLAVILIDDGSFMQYDIFKYKNIHFITFIKLDSNNGPANARNVGLEYAFKHYNPKIISFIDSDCILPKDYILNVFDGFIKKSYAFGLSGITYSFGKSIFDKYHNINGTLNGRYFIESKDSNLLLYAPTCNISFVASSIESLRFNTDFPNAASEDIYFCFEFLQKGFYLTYIDSMILYHNFNYKAFCFFYNLKKFKNLFKKYAMGEKILLEKIPNYYSYLDKTSEITMPTKI